MNAPAPPERPPSPVRRFTGALVASLIDAALLALALGGIGPLVRDARAVTLIVIWTATSLALAWVRPAPRERAARGAESPAVLLALVVLPLFTPALSALSERFGFAVIPGGAALHGVGIALVALGLALRVAAIAQLGRRFSSRVTLQPEHTLETRGLYARMRHPGYLGALSANLGAALAFSSLVGVILTALLALALRARVAGEERLLAERFGGEYEAYRARTGALLPRLGAVPPAGAGAERRP